MSYKFDLNKKNIQKYKFDNNFKFDINKNKINIFNLDIPLTKNLSVESIIIPNKGIYDIYTYNYNIIAIVFSNDKEKKIIYNYDCEKILYDNEIVGLITNDSMEFIILAKEIEKLELIKSNNIIIKIIYDKKNLNVRSIK